MSTKDLNKKTEEYVTGLFNKMKNDHLVFHNLKHTQSVVKRSAEIGEHYKLNDKDKTILNIASWFHDTGHLFTEPDKHEEMGVELMRKFMDEHSTDSEMPNEIADCIMATKFPRNPRNLLQEIICDADTYHFGTKDFKKTNKQVKQEDELRGHLWNKEEYIKCTIDFLKSHQFYTDYCKQLLSEQKELNMKKLKDKLADREKSTKVTEVDNEKLSMLEKDKSGLVSKGIQTMLRLTSGNHLKLSEMADHKASILISVNSIIISVILGVLVRKLQEEPFLEIPTIIFLVVAVSVIVISILATRPQLGAGRFTSQDVQDKKTNLLFFGNFYKTSYEEYSNAMKSLMVDTDYLYDSLVKDIYYLAVVLGRKYRLIRLAYNIFMFGIIITVLAFVIAFTFYHGAAATNPVVNGTGSPL
jgi:predicted metal-dependent HD superfamily phosphohydrolase